MNTHRPIEHSESFGTDQVTPDERDRRMRATFHLLAPHYDRLCDVMTLGLHRYWRRVLAGMVNAHAHGVVLDVAGGAGEVARGIAQPGREVIVLDFSLPMLETGASRQIEGVHWVAASASALPFGRDSVDAVTIAFGLRNVTYVGATLREILRVLRPGGRFYCLEVSQPWAILRPLHRVYCRHVVPRLGLRVTRAEHAFNYLVESLHSFPGHSEIRDLMMRAGFEDVRYHLLSLGIACIHTGVKR